MVALTGYLDESGSPWRRPQIVRAMENLKLALRLRLSRPARRGAGSKDLEPPRRSRQRSGGELARAAGWTHGPEPILRFATSGDWWMLVARLQRRVPLLNFLLLFDYSLDYITNTHPSPE